MERLTNALKKLPLSGSKIGGVNGRKGKHFVFVTGDLTEAELAEVQAAITGHNPDEKTAEEIAEETRKAALETLRDNDKPLDIADYDRALPLLKQLAEKVRLLEAEIRALKE